MAMESAKVVSEPTVAALLAYSASCVVALAAIAASFARFVNVAMTFAFCF